jgi:hypothetical protein
MFTVGTQHEMNYLNHHVLNPVVLVIFGVLQCLKGHALAHLAEALRYKSEGCGFDFRWCHWNFSFTYSFRPQYGPGVDSASNSNEYFLWVKAAGA